MKYDQVQEKVNAFVQGIYVAEGIRRSSYGMIGGRSIGIGTTVADPSQWQSVFGVELTTAISMRSYIERKLWMKNVFKNI